MIVFLDKPYLFILLRDDDRWFLSVPCAASAVSYDREIELMPEQIELFHLHGQKVIQEIAEKIQNSPIQDNLEKQSLGMNLDKSTKSRIDKVISESGKRTCL